MRYLVAVCAVALLAAGGAGAVTVHTLALAGRSPVVVTGTGFTPGSLVRVSVTAGRRHLTRVVRTSTGGRVHAKWLQSVPPCSVVLVTAAARNDRLMTRSLPASTATCGGPSGPPGPPVVGP
jgi:hypothetical protein